jgi:hypothetical protein
VVADRHRGVGGEGAKVAQHQGGLRLQRQSGRVQGSRAWAASIIIKKKRHLAGQVERCREPPPSAPVLTDVVAIYHRNMSVNPVTQTAASNILLVATLRR